MKRNRRSVVLFVTVGWVSFSSRLEGVDMLHCPEIEKRQSARLSEQPLLVRVKPVHPSLGLSRRRALLKANTALLDAVLEFGDGADANVLERVLDAGVEVREELFDGALVDDGPRDALGDLDFVTFGEVSEQRRRNEVWS